MSDFFGGIWRSIKGYASDGINGVLNVINAGVDAIDSVWKFFTGHETSIHHLQPVKFAQGGVVTQRLAMVNDGEGPDWKELIQLPNGDMKMSQKRNAVMPLPVGTRIYNGAETKAIMNYAGIEKYANGGVVGGAIDWAKGALSNVGSWIGDKFDAIDSFLKNPLNAVMGLIQKATSGLIGGLGNFGQLASGTLDKLMSPISDWFTKGLKKVQEEGQGAPAGAGVQRWADQVKQALSANGLSTSDGMVQKVLRQIQTESGGNEKAVQGGYTDVNTISGDLAKGLMQTISATFNAYAFPGHHNIFNGYDNLLAALAYAKNRYGSNLSYLGQGHGYANGGLITQHQIAEIGEGNKPEMIIPLDGMKSSRGFELLGKTAVAMAARDGFGSQNVVKNDNSDVVSELKAAVALLTQLVIGQQENKTTNVVLDKNALYKQQAIDTSLRNYQSFA
ncbi:transglycosylase SLT domain-containing protein [Leuconostoc lactis]|nr:transglycosylase SLT domain-containing protein [Leuconostoc lactis]